MIGAAYQTVLGNQSWALRTVIS